MGRVHARHYSKFSDVEILVFDADKERAAAYSKDTGARITDSADSLIGSSDAVDVCLPTHLHLEFASKALSAGKPTLCEKPLARTVAECAQLVLLSDTLNVPLIPGQVVRYFAEFRKANEIVKRGAIGKPAAIRTRRGGLAPKGHGGWFGDKTRSGGVILDLMVHDFDWIRWTFGEVERVFCQSLNSQSESGIDYALATLTLDSGAIAHCEGTWADPSGFRVTFEAAGSEGFLEYDSRLSPAVKTSSVDGNWNENPLAPDEDPYFLQLRSFLRVVQNRAQSPVTAVDGLRAVAIAEAAIQSAAIGRPVVPAKA